ncbi:F-actin-methionine sulfoxide oxidase mical1 [Hondaea fermentalgiana]|uniref:F-actin-methionine sulfoxide oxidase mical1 n=1 Tax=Hondaea fermentalgiana TaxID=2315210 RepID=A0A2R5G172_9STRA|nr:F-actin-methionine sulfoxide oxidase mical1 [Hondaea fermentalgiana]|eukprot:GBG24766.1 F-actin-methionine sulfoxide oxidase mical1 [Hondaea fermentalgiana]
MSSADDLLTAFLEANEVDQVLSSFAAFAAIAGVDPEGDCGLEVYARLRKTTRSSVRKFKLRRIFDVLDKELDKRRALVADDGASYPSLDVSEDPDEDVEDDVQANAHANRPMRIVVSGAGPVGLRSALENALLGHEVVVLEKRERFSRVNILMFWQATMDDMVSLGAKLFYPKLQVHGSPLHMGTREIQLCLLKTALLFGVQVRYATSLRALRFDAELETWAAIATSSAPARTEGALRRLSGRVADALSFKPKKTADYEATFRCNMVDNPQLDPTFLKGVATAEEKEVSFDSLIVAEGEWSQSLRKLGFQKSVDRFSRAIGIVINMDYDPSKPDEAALESFALGISPKQNAVKERLKESGIFIENIEYLKGTTHYIVATLWKTSSLLDHGVLREGASAGQDLLRAENVDFTALQDFARIMATAVGIPEETPFCAWNPIQLFDFSTRARAMSPSKILMTDSSNEPLILDELGSEDEIPKNAALVMPVGDALLEPFWPQGLGSNRGFHGAIDAAYACLRFRTAGLYEGYVSRAFSYLCMNMYAWTKPTMVIQNWSAWSADPATRYTWTVVDTAKKQSGRILGYDLPPTVFRRFTKK